MDNYYNITISKFWLVFWLIIGVLFSFATMFLILLVPLYYYLVLKNCKYYYDDNKIIIETGVLNKKQNIVPLYRIINITAEDNIFNFGRIYIKDKGQVIILKYVKNSKHEMLQLVEKWENAKKQNVRNEVI